MRIEDFSDEWLAKVAAQLEHVVDSTSKDIQETAISLAREDKTPWRDDIVLKKSIKQTLVNSFLAFVYVEGEANAYALVQEYGHPAYPWYGFTPYMRPAIGKHRERFIQRVREALL